MQTILHMIVDSAKSQPVECPFDEIVPSVNSTYIGMIPEEYRGICALAYALEHNFRNREHVATMYVVCGTLNTVFSKELDDFYFRESYSRNDLHVFQFAPQWKLYAVMERDHESKRTFH